MKSGMTQDHDVVDEVAASHLAFQELEIEDFKGHCADYLVQWETTAAV